MAADLVVQARRRAAYTPAPDRLYSVPARSKAWACSRCGRAVYFTAHGMIETEPADLDAAAVCRAPSHEAPGVGVAHDCAGGTRA